MFGNTSLKQLFTMMVLAAASRGTSAPAGNPLVPRLPKLPVSRQYPRCSEGERVRRMGQILLGTHRVQNGLARDSQLVSRPDGKLQVRRPY